MPIPFVAHALLLAPQLAAAGQAAPAAELARPLLFADPHELLPQRGSTGCAALGDIDGDGDLDVCLVLGRWFVSEAQLEVWENTGAGRLRLAQPRGGSFAYTAVADLADFDGDLDLDLLAGDTLFRNDGRGTFTRDPFDQPDRLRAHARRLADLDGDGDLDVYATTNWTGGLGDYLFLNDGAGHFADASASLPAGASGASALALGDVDGDGDHDLLASGNAGLRLYLNDGAALFSDASGQLPAGGVARGLSLADVDGDQDLDALSFSGLYLNDGTGLFTDASAQLPPLLAGAGGLVLDVDGDGDPDLVAGPTWLNDGSGSFSDALVAFPPGGGRHFPGDLDGDGDPDLLRTFEDDPFLSYAGGGTEILLGDGVRAFLSERSATRELLGLHGPVPLLADMNGDGYLDAVSGLALDEPFGSYEQKTFLGYNDGHGRFGDTLGSLPPISTLPTVLAAADLDDDGDTDLLIGGLDNADGTGGSLDLMFQQGGVFVHPSGHGSSIGLGNDTRDIAVGDLDGDGDVDVLHCNTWTLAFPDGVLHNDGTGTFSPDPGLNAFLEAHEVELFDLEQDGDLDVLISGVSSALYRNEPAGWVDVSAQLGFATGMRVATGDTDADGDTDLLVGDQGGVRLHANDGSGTFSLARVLVSAAGFEAFSAQLVDVDADGDLDALTQDLSFAGRQVAPRLHVNDGRGRLLPGRARLPLFSLDRAAFGDVDQDGDADALAGRLLFNLTRQLSWRTPPQLGRTLTLELRGPALRPWTLYSSPSAAQVPIPGQGILLLGPPLATRGSGTLDHLGRAAFSSAVPNNPALIGASLHWQALVGAPARFTNRETTTVSGH